MVSDHFDRSNRRTNSIDGICVADFATDVVQSVLKPPPHRVICERSDVIFPQALTRANAKCLLCVAYSELAIHMDVYGVDQAVASALEADSNVLRSGAGKGAIVGRPAK